MPPALRKLLIFLALAMNVFALGSEVIKITSDPRLIGVSLDFQKQYTVGDTLCFERSGENLGCGTVTKILKRGAAVELESSQVALQLGDKVVGRAPASTLEATEESSTSENIKLKKQRTLGKANIGFNYPDYSTTSSSYSKLFSYLIGIGAEIPLSQAISFEPSLFYSPEWVSATSSSVTARVSVAYLEVPFYFKFKPFYKTASRLTPYILIGPSYGYLLSAKLFYEGVNTPETDFTSLLNSSRISLNSAVGFDTEVSDSLSLGFSIRYLLAISSPTRASSSSGSARLLQGLVTLGWDYENDVFED